MSKYHKRILTYDDKTQMYKVSVPELGIEVTSDTETSALLEARDEVAKAATRRQPTMKDIIQDTFWDGLDLKIPSTSVPSGGAGGGYMGHPSTCICPLCAPILYQGRGKVFGPGSGFNGDPS